MKAFIYLNDGDDHWCGFKADHVAGLDLVAVVDETGSEDHATALENMFYQFNMGSGYTHRSLSVGDVVLLEDADEKQTAYACASMGWDKLADGVVRVVTV